MATLGPGQIRFRVHGPDPAGDEVSAAVFADKLMTLVRALRAADKALNGVLMHDYVIARLRTSTPTAVLAERPLPKYDDLVSGQSGISGFDDCVQAITIGERDRALRYGNCAVQIGKLAKGSQSRFGYAEVWTREETIIRVDPFLTERTRAIVAPPTELEAPPISATRDWFKGTAYGSFDGEIRAVDLRGALPELKLILTAGRKQVDCVCRGIDIETIRTALNRRVRLSGLAIYDGKSGLPRRIEVNEIIPVPPPGDITRWAGSFEPFAPSEWEGDEL